MEKKIKLELFRFDIKTDYLPYFAKLLVKIDSQKSLLDLLKIVQKNVLEYGYNAYGFKINGVVVFDFGLKIEDLIKNFGLEWKIEPLNPHLAIKDLMINVEPFLQKLESLKQVGLDELAQDEVQSVLKDMEFRGLEALDIETQDIKNVFLLSFLPFAYATPLSVENSEYLGEAYFILVASLYAKHKTPKILETICKLENGIFNAQNLQTYLFPPNAKFDKCINELKMIAFEMSENSQVQALKSKLIKKVNS
ncbi:DUF5644 domain-containing protein [uncultured Helicobacter sp.]|uniref:DUF5644 domain-containing protein n=1 Tax=uncultured Helicobacter sp. TaxID=175537 RepID=UPI00262765E2|nr:DUF5644 domain-containing protein [uncultured Helicobacter sp.]